MFSSSKLATVLELAGFEIPVVNVNIAALVVRTFALMFSKEHIFIPMQDLGVRGSTTLKVVSPN